MFGASFWQYNLYTRVPSRLRGGVKRQWGCRQWQLDPSRSRDVIGHMTIWFPIGHFLLVVLWNQVSISLTANGFRDIQWRMWRSGWHDHKRPLNKGQGHSFWYQRIPHIRLMISVVSYYNRFVIVNQPINVSCLRTSKHPAVCGIYAGWEPVMSLTYTVIERSASVKILRSRTDRCAINSKFCTRTHRLTT